VSGTSSAGVRTVREALDFVKSQAKLRCVVTCPENFAMPLATFPHRPTTRNSPVNLAWLAQEYLDRPNSAINARQSAGGGRCGACNRKPPSGELCEVVLDTTTNLVARIGIGRCHFDFFRAALEDLLPAERRRHHANKAVRILKLETAIAALPLNL
jgi:hypothetical protein